MIDKSNRPADVQQGAIDRINWFFSLTPQARRPCYEEIATNIYSEPMAQRWGNWVKAFSNNTGVAAKATAVCLNHPRSDMSVWGWRCFDDRDSYVTKRFMGSRRSRPNRG
jgi:hypothetical protein